MERIVDADGNIVSQRSSSSSSVVALAIKGNKKSKYVVQWALNKFVPEGMIIFKLIHVHANIQGVPTPMGNVIPLSQVRNDVATAFRKEVEWGKNQMMLPFKRLCEQRKVHVDVVVIESDDVAIAVAEEVAKGAITKLVVGTSSSGIFKSKQKGMSMKISVSTPRFCTVYAISKGKLSIRQSDMPIDVSIMDDASETSFSSSSSSNYTSTSQTESTSVSSYAGLHSSSLATQRFQALSSINSVLLSTNPSLSDTSHSRGQSIDLGRENTATISARNSDIDHALSRVSSCKSFISDTESWMYDQNSIKDVALATTFPSPNMQAKFNLELEKLRIELRHAQGLHAVAQSEKTEACRKLNDLSKRRSEETMKMKEIVAKEDKAEELAKLESEKYQDASREAVYLKECAEREAAERKETELRVIRATKEKEKLVDALSGTMLQYRKFTWDEIVSATSSFSEDLRIGMGAYGTVYKCNLYHTTVAVKVLNTNGNRESKQFQQELEILSRIRHPNLLLLLGASHKVEIAIEDGNLTDILDPEAGAWPFKETLDLAVLGLSCAELRRRDRPDLKDQVLPTLERLKEVADRAQHSASTVTIKSKPPNHFICPILQDVMDDPCVAADGYTYDRKAIDKWLQENDNSPMTNMALPHKHLIPNYTLLSAILEWKSRES
ncbi:hypothetical protein ACSQ67_009679 [Phaseolus vulgaris]